MRGNWREGSFTGDPERYVKEIYQERCKMPSKYISLSIRAPLGSWRVFARWDFLREKD